MKNLLTRQWYLPLLLSAIPGCISVEDHRLAETAAGAEVSRHGWEHYKVESVRRVKGHWRVDVVMIPYIPGGAAQVEVSRDGKVVGFRSGL